MWAVVGQLHNDPVTINLESCSTSATVKGVVEQVGIRELRQQASELVRRASLGEEIVIGVSGYPAAKLVPLSTRQWRKGRDLNALFTAVQADPDWASERRADDGIDQDPRNPWERAGL